MMIPFDTLDYARQLEALGVPQDQAEGQTRALFEVLSQFLAVRYRANTEPWRPVLQVEPEIPSLPVRLVAVPGLRQLVGWLLWILLAVDVVMSVVYLAVGQ